MDHSLTAENRIFHEKGLISLATCLFRAICEINWSDENALAFPQVIDSEMVPEKRMGDFRRPERDTSATDWATQLIGFATVAIIETRYDHCAPEEGNDV